MLLLLLLLLLLLAAGVGFDPPRAASTVEYAHSSLLELELREASGLGMPRSLWAVCRGG